MLLGDVFETFAKKSPICVMVRGTLENALPPEFVDKIFEEHAKRQYKRELLFSSVVDVMATVVCKIRPSVNAAYQHRREEFTVDRRSLYGKINKVEPQTLQALVRQTAQRLAPVIEHMRGTLPEIVPGYRVKILDGNHLAASEHRISELRTIAAGPLPGQSLVVLDPRLMMVVDVFPCEDGHAQERSILPQVLETIEKGELWIDDRNFCTRPFLFGIASRDAFFLVRHHATNVPWQPLGKRYKIGRTETGMVYQQHVEVRDASGNSLVLRRITIKLDHPTRDGDTEIHLLTNLPDKIRARMLADAYRNRWRIETAFGELATTLNSEISSLGYPPAALFGFCVALVAYNVLSVVKAALRAAFGVQTIEKELSAYYLADELRSVMGGMMIAIPPEHWIKAFAHLSPRQLARVLIDLAKQVDLCRFQKHPRGPKKPPPKRKRDKHTPHVSTARILAQRKTARR
jgi:IS4 transposase